MTKAVVIPVKADTKDAAKDITSLSSLIVGKLTPVVDVGNLVAGSFNLVKDSIAAASEFMKENIALADTQETAERRLISALKSRGEVTDGVLGSIQKWNAETQKATGIGDEVLLSLQSQAVALGATGDELELVTKAAIGWADATGKDLKNAIIDATKVINGNIGPIQRYNKSVTDISGALEFMSAGFEVAKDRSKQLVGQFEQLEANTGDLREEFGRLVTESEQAVGLLEDINREILDLARVFGEKKDPLKQAVDDTFGALRTALSWIVENKAAVSGAITSIAAATVASMAPIVASFAPIASLAAALGLGGAAAGAAAAGAAPTAGGGQVAPGKIPVTDLGDPTAETPEEKKKRLIAEREALRAAKDREKAAKRIAKENAKRQEAIAAFAADAASAQRAADADEAQRARDHERTKLDIQQSGFDERLKQSAKEIDGQAAIAGQVRDILAGSIAENVIAFAQGDQSIQESVGRMVGGVISGIGTLLITVGSAAVATTALSFIPFFAGLLGPPGASAAAGAVAIAVGAGMVALGSALGGAFSAPSGAASPGGAGSGGTSRAGPSNAPVGTRFGAAYNPDDFRNGSGDPNRRNASFGAQGGGGTRVVNINATVLGGTRRQVGRAVQDLLDEQRRTGSGRRTAAI